ncbi:MAG TPA: hypothetical protein VFW69_00655 [Mycobacterium sp.]|nr:hypothetical protein [Mycobacterium sp.]
MTGRNADAPWTALVVIIVMVIALNGLSHLIIRVFDLTEVGGAGRVTDDVAAPD